MFKKVIQQGSSERKAEAVSWWYVEGLSDAETKLMAFFNILLGHHARRRQADTRGGR